MKKKTRKSKNKINKKLKLIVIVIIAIILVTTSGLIIYFKVQKENKEKENVKVELLATELLGEKRLEEQKKVYDIIDKYIKDNQELKNYIESKNITTISLKDIKDNLKVDISEFENLTHKCNPEDTTIDFTNGFENYIVSLSCDAFLLSR